MTFLRSLSRKRSRPEEGEESFLARGRDTLGQTLSKDEIARPLSLTLVMALLAVLLGMALVNLLALVSLASREPPVYVELQDGRTIGTNAIGHYERTEQSILRFVRERMEGLMNWRGYLEPRTPEEARSPRPDPGVPVEGGRKIATGAYEAGFALDEVFRREFLSKLAALTPQEIFATAQASGRPAFSSTQVLLDIRFLAPPRPVAPGQWKVRMVAKLLYVRASDRLGRAIAFNKEVFVRAVEFPAPKARPTDTEAILLRAREAGLEIYAIRDFDRDDLKAEEPN